MWPLDLLARWVAAGLAVAALGGWGWTAWQLRSARQEAQGLRLTLAEREAMAADAQAKVAQLAAKIQRQVVEAMDDARTNEAALRAAADDARAAADRLRDDLARVQAIRRASRGGSGGAGGGTVIVPATTVPDASDTASELLGDCARAYSDMAAAADRHAADVKTLIRAWPQP